MMEMMLMKNDNNQYDNIIPKIEVLMHGERVCPVLMCACYLTLDNHMITIMMVVMRMMRTKMIMMMMMRLILKIILSVTYDAVHQVCVISTPAVSIILLYFSSSSLSTLSLLY